MFLIPNCILSPFNDFCFNLFSLRVNSKSHVQDHKKTPWNRSSVCKWVLFSDSRLHMQHNLQLEATTRIWLVMSSGSNLDTGCNEGCLALQVQLGISHVTTTTQIWHLLPMTAHIFGMLWLYSPQLVLVNRNVVKFPMYVHQFSSTSIQCQFVAELTNRDK